MKRSEVKERILAGIFLGLVIICSLDGRIESRIKGNIYLVLSGSCLILFIMGLLIAFIGYVFKATKLPAWDVWQDWFVAIGMTLSFMAVGVAIFT